MFTRPIDTAELRKTATAAGAAARAWIADLSVAFKSQIDPKGMKIVAGGAGLALVLGLGAGFVGRAPIDRALAQHPMVPIPGASQIVAVAPPLITPPHAPAPVAVVMADDAPTIATGDDPPADLQEGSADPSEAQGDDDRQTAVNAPPPPPDDDPD